MTTVIAEQTLIQKILNSDLGRKVVKERRKETLSERQEHVKAIKKLTVEAEIEFTKLRDQADKDLEKVKVAQMELKAAQEKYKRSRMVMSSRSNVLSSQVGRHERALRESSDPAIAEFLSWLNKLITNLLNTGPEFLREGFRMDGAKTREYDRAGFQKTRDKIEEIYTLAEGLKLQAVDDVPKELAKLRGEVPKNYYTQAWDFS